MIEIKKKIKLLSVLMAVVLMAGCGKLKDELPVKSGLSIWIYNCRLEIEILKNKDNREVLENCKRMFLQTKDNEETDALQDWVDIIEEEKQKNYTILCTDRLYDLLEERLSEKERKDFQIYLPALQGETSLYYTTVTDDEDNLTEMSEDGKFSIEYSCVDEITINDYCRFLEGLWYEYNWIRRISLTDLDEDGKKELIICTVYDNRTLVLHEEDGRIYMVDFWPRMYEDFQKEWEAFHINEEIRWYAVDNEENIALSAYEQLKIFAENYKEWMSDKGNHYSYCIYDFDQDGCLELLVTINDFNIENYFYRVTGNGIEELEKNNDAIEGKEKDICNERNVVAFYDKNTGNIYYRRWNYGDSNEAENREYFSVEKENISYTVMSVAEVEKDSNIKKVVGMRPILYNVEDRFLDSEGILSNLIESYEGGEY